MSVDFLLRVFSEKADVPAFFWRGSRYTYSRLSATIRQFEEQFQTHDIEAGSVVALESPTSPIAVAALLALAKLRSILVPLAEESVDHVVEYSRIAQVQKYVGLEPESGRMAIRQAASGPVSNPLLKQLIDEGRAGLILFTSGSTGEAKGVVHDLDGLLSKFHRRRKDLTTLAFLRLDHIGGLDTLFYALSNGSPIVIAEDRTPDEVCRLVEQHQVEVLPVTPSFLNLLMLSDAYKDYDLSSLKYVTYGAEVMPQETLDRCRRTFPDAVLLQKYGATEFGALRSRSESSQSLWVRVGGETYQTRVRDGMLEVKGPATMLGYLNAPSPFTADGWVRTGDRVDVRGDYIRFLGRASEVINVGGRKVYPAEVESVLCRSDLVAEAVVFGESNPVLGQVVSARVRLKEEPEVPDAEDQLKAHCRRMLDDYKVPVRVRVTTGPVEKAHFKKIRSRGRADC